ncbi:dihydrolipoyl dehydrogenase [bacterium]|nr:dihydrolipoyl dehydrogenase [bacterium]
MVNGKEGSCYPPSTIHHSLLPMYDILVIGSGPGGYVAAIRAAQLGFKVACVEKDKTLGGTCLNVGCIPSKALLESSELYHQTQHELEQHGIEVGKTSLNWDKMLERKSTIVKQLTGGIAMLFKKNKIDSFVGTATFNADKTVTVGSEKLSAKHIIIATGSVPSSIPGLEVNQETVLDSTGALALKKVPGKMIVIGAGAIGLEMGSVYARLGTEITVVEALDKIVPSMDGEVGKAFLRVLQKQNMKFMLSTKVGKATLGKKGVTLSITNDKNEASELTADCVLVAIGRKANTEGLGLDAVGIKKDERGRITVNKNFETNVPGIYAIGDVIAGPMLAHKASEEGVVCVEMIAGQKPHINYDVVPAIVYTHPEVASVGLTEEEAVAKGIEIKKAKFLFMANGRALALGTKEGFVKLIADKNTDRLLGAHIMGPRASDLIAELALAIEFKASAEDVARTIHAHPTLAEVTKEAALGLGSGAIHS